MTILRNRTLLTVCCLALVPAAVSAQSAGAPTLVGSPSPQTMVLEAKPQQAQPGAAQPPAARPATPPRKPLVLKRPVYIAPQGPQMESRVDSFDLDFSGDAADTMRQLARPAPVSLRSEARALIAADAQAENCSLFADGDRVFFADLDGDRRPEGLVIYTLESCGGGGNNYARSAIVLRESPTQGWVKASEFTMGTKLRGNRVVTRIAGGALTLAGNSEAFSSSEPPETVRIPPAGG